MGYYRKYAVTGVALLVMGSATLLMSCRNTKTSPPNPETLVTQKSDTLTVIVSKNGQRQYRFKTPLMERYQEAREPYMEFKKGIYIETYKDSTEEIESTLIADYAIYFEKRELWRAQRNVVGTGIENRTLYTEQLFWDEKTGRVYSNVESTVVQGEDVFVGEGFESDERFEFWTFRNFTGRLWVDMQGDEEESDSVSMETYGPPDDGMPEGFVIPEGGPGNGAPGQGQGNIPPEEPADGTAGNAAPEGARGGQPPSQDAQEPGEQAPGQDIRPAGTTGAGETGQKE